MPELNLELKQIINFRQYPIDNEVFIEQCATELDKKGVLTLPNFINNETLLELTIEAKENQFKAYYAKTTHNIYLTEKEAFADACKYVHWLRQNNKKIDL